MNINYKDRSGYCLCCGNQILVYLPAIFSSFLAQRSIDSSPFITNIITCIDCGFKWSQRGLSDSEVTKLYEGYRGENYFKLRNHYEPWYSKKINYEIGSENSIIFRRNDLMNLLKTSGINEKTFLNIADHGGDRGQMLHEFSTEFKFVYDLSGVDLDNGILILENVHDRKNFFDLVLTCHVLEHMNDPKSGLQEVLSLVKDGGFIYLEVPYEDWKSFPELPYQKNLIEFIIKYPFILKWIDLFLTVLRVKLKIIPPYGFKIIQEHLNFFTKKSIQHLIIKSGLKVISIKKSSQGHWIALGQKCS
jgi:SAM-dependent methyltransferase